MTKPQNIIIQTKYIKGNKVWCWNGKPYASEYLARLAATRALQHLQKSIIKQ